MDHRLRGVLLAAGGMVALSTDSLFVRLADTNSFDVVFWVGLFTTVVLLGGGALLDRRAFVDELRSDATVVADNPTIEEGEITYEIPPLDPGTYTFICSVHPIPAMTGTLTVE